MSLTLLKNSMAVLLLGLLFSCAQQTLSTSEMLKIAGREKLPTQKDYPQAGGVFLYQKMDTRLVFDKQWRAGGEERYHQALLYFDDRADAFLNPTFTLGFKERLVDFSARIIKPNGETVALTEKNIRSLDDPERPETYNGTRRYGFTFADVTPGSILEYRYKIKRFRRPFFNQVWRIQETLPKLYSSYSIEFPAKFISKKRGWTFTPVNIRLGDAVIKRHTRKNDRMEFKTLSYNWELRDIPALRLEPAMPPYDEAAQYLRIDYKLSDWNKLSGRYWEMLKPFFPPAGNASLKKLAMEAAGDAETSLQKIENILSFLRNRYRYIGEEMDGYLLPPRDVAELLKQSSVNSRDMTVLTVNLLRALGLEARPALVKTADRGRRTETVLAFDFNRMITLTRDDKGRAIWLDPACAVCPPGEVSPALEGTRPLVFLDNGKSSLEKIPPSRARQNRITREASLNADGDGNVAGTVTLLFRGNCNLRLRNILAEAGAGEREKVIRGLLRDDLPGARLEEINSGEPHRAADSLRISFKLTFKANTESDGQFILPASLFKNRPQLKTFAAGDRRHPLFFPSPFSVKDILKVGYDRRQFEIGDRPRGLSGRQPFGRVRSRLDFGDEGAVSYSIDYDISKRRIDASDYEDFRGLLKNLDSIQNMRLVLKKK